MTTRLRITALLNDNIPRSDKDIATELRLPESSVRRTRLHMVAAGDLVFARHNIDGCAAWRNIGSNDAANTYTGEQNIKRAVPYTNAGLR